MKLWKVTIFCEIITSNQKRIKGKRCLAWATGRCKMVLVELKVDSGNNFYCLKCYVGVLIFCVMSWVYVYCVCTCVLCQCIIHMFITIGNLAIICVCTHICIPVLPFNINCYSGVGADCCKYYRTWADLEQRDCNNHSCCLNYSSV